MGLPHLKPRQQRIVLEIESADDRPKSNVYHPVKWPEELLADLEAEAQRYNPPKAIGDVIKDCCEFRLLISRGLRYGYYGIREFLEAAQPQLGNTNIPAVTPPQVRPRTVAPERDEKH